jgi:hypothetical protein
VRAKAKQKMALREKLLIELLEKLGQISERSCANSGCSWSGARDSRFSFATRILRPIPLV